MWSEDGRSKISKYSKKISKFKFSLPYLDAACKMHLNEYKQA